LSIKAVVFDYGNVISLTQDPKVMDCLTERVGVEKEKFVSSLWSLRGEYDRGTIGAKEYFKTVLSNLAVFMDEESIEELIEIDSNSWKNINTETEALMKELKEAGYLVGILSNIPYEFLAWAKKNLPVFSLPHIGLYSCEVHLIKPEEAIYRKLLSMFAVEADELVFFDDKVENVKGAEEIGIKAVLWKNSKEARRELISLGVKLE
jgi:putative hydrolase of the HAD superfamily